MWEACQGRWNGQCRLVTLTKGSERRPPSVLSPLRFGAELAAAQSFGDCGWLFYSHSSIARVQALMPRGFRRPYAVFLHGIEAWAPYSNQQRRVLQGAAALIANSAYTARRVSEAHPSLQPIAACPLALPPNEVSRTGATEPFAVGPSTVIIVARLDAAERYKGHDQLLEAWPTVVSQVPDAQLLVVGGGDDLTRLQKKAAGLSVGDSIIFTGFVPELIRESLYDRAAVFAMPSRNEGFGLVYLEAMAHGLPCVGSVHDAAGEIIVDAVTGFLVNQAETPAIADRLIRLLSDPALRRQMGDEGRRRLERCFSYERFEGRLLSLLDGAFGSEA